MDALFDIDDDGEDGGFEATNGQTYTLKLRNPAGAVHVLFQVYDAAGANPDLGVAAQPPRASKGAPELTLVGATSGQAVSPTTPSNGVDVTLPGTGSHSWIVRCVRDQGLRVLPGGKVVVDPSLIHERGIWIPTPYGTRKPVATEVQQFESEGWAGALADHIEAGTAGAPVDLVDLIDNESITWTQTQTFSGSLVLGTSQLESGPPPFNITLAANITRLFLLGLVDGDVVSITGANAGRAVFVQNVSATRVIKHSTGTSSSLICPGGHDLVVGPRDSFWLIGDGANGWLVSSSRPTYLAPWTGSVARAVNDRLGDNLHVFDFMTAAQRASAQAGNFSMDLQPVIQLAVDWALYQNSTGFSSGRRVKLGPGRYRIDRPIHLGYGTDFRGILFEGEGKSEGGTDDAGGAGTVIKVNFSNAPGICIQGGRGTTVRGMTLLGINTKPFEIAVGSADMANLNPAAWVSAGLAANAGSRYAPYAAIAIDPYTGPTPTPAYPAVTYPAFLGAVAQYNKGQSRDILIDDVTIKSFVVGVVQQPGEADGNGDFTKLSRVNFWFCQYGFSWGNSQARVNELDHCVWAYCHTCIASSVHGLQIGMPQFIATACAFETSISHFECMNLGYGAGPVFVGCFSEAMYMLGKCGGVSQDSGSLKFLNCEWGFTFWDTYGVPTWVLECEGSMQVRFENTFFYVTAQRAFLHFRTSGSALLGEPARQLAFEGCQTNLVNFDGAGLYAKAAHNATMGITTSLGSTCMDRWSCKSGWLHNLDTGAALAVGVLHTETALARRHVGAPVYAKRLKSLIQGNDPGVDVAWQTYGFVIATVVSTVGRVVTFTFADTNTAYLMHFGGDVGDIYVSAATGAVFVVKSRTLMQLSMEAMSGYDKDGNLLNSIVAGGLLHPINCRRYALPAVLYGDITSGSPIVTNLKLGSGGTATLADILTADDYLYVDQEVDQVINPFDGSARLVSFNQGAATMTFAGNFNYTQTRRRFAIFVRPAFPNA